jgi:arylsulfatase A-like enzyme
MGAGKLIHPTGNVVPKIFHGYGPGTGIVGGPFTSEELATKNMDPTYTVRRGKVDVVLPMNGISTIDRPNNQYSTFDWGPVDLTDDEPDGQIANWAMQKLNNSYKKPFFLGVGFYRPHQPFFVPRKYFKYYSPHNIVLPPTIVGDLEDLSETGHNFALLPWTWGRHNTVVKHNQWREAVSGYLAAITFADAQVGKVLDALDTSPHADKTIIVFCSDHGWHLGEKEHWGNHSISGTNQK